MDQILDHELRGQGTFYQIKWKGYEGKDSVTWEPAENLTVPAVEAYHRSLKGKESR